MEHGVAQAFRWPLRGDPSLTIPSGSAQLPGGLTETEFGGHCRELLKLARRAYGHYVAGGDG